MADRILTTHTGSLPRPPALGEVLNKIEHGQAEEDEAFDAQVTDAVNDIVAKQRAAGVDIANDGEMSKVSYSTYVVQRLTGFGGTGKEPHVPDMDDFPGWGAMTGLDQLGNIMVTPACIGDVKYENTHALEADIANLKAAAEANPGADVFMSAASPGVISLFLEDQHYGSHEDYLKALADAMKTEYDAIHEAGFILQLDCPDLAMGRHIQYPGKSLEEWKDIIRVHVEAINEATQDIPSDRMRVHLCWGNYEGPHHCDVPISDILDVVLKARPSGLSFEGANPRHEHEWRAFGEIDVPDDKVLVPGVIDSTTNYIEHPQVVADRLENYARVVGPDRVIASTDCGFATFHVLVPVEPNVVFAKLQAMADGAEIASKAAV